MDARRRHQSLISRNLRNPVGATIGFFGNISHALTGIARRLLRDNRAVVKRYFEHVYRHEDPYDIADDPVEAEKRDGSMAAIAGRRFARALEIGGGEGRLAARLAAQCDALLMVDLSRRALERARRRLDGQPHAAARQLDIVAEPLPAGNDLIVCSEVLIYVQRKELEDIRRKIVAALAPRGRLLLVHSRSIHDDDAGLEYKDFGAQTVHGAFIGAGDLEVVSDATFDMYRITLLRRAAAT